MGSSDQNNNKKNIFNTFKNNTFPWYVLHVGLWFAHQEQNSPHYNTKTKFTKIPADFDVFCNILLLFLLIIFHVMPCNISETNGSHKRFSGARRTGTIHLTRGDFISQTSSTVDL